RHRVGFSFSAQSQRYVRMGSDDRSGGFDYVVPDKVEHGSEQVHFQRREMSDGGVDYGFAHEVFREAMDNAQYYYDMLRKSGVPAEDARAVLPNAAATNLVMTANLTALLSFYYKRKKGRGAQAEITELAEALRREVVDVEPWTDQFFEEV
ncbi:FAD-dependent thymidylate synthase, partial [Bacillus subtilis]|uniref:FAD-dependent thymidylate synthase n=1 Tax=Bacillus subtilis TaxID=1423 RepID=UPI00214A069A